MEGRSCCVGEPVDLLKLLGYFPWVLILIKLYPNDLISRNSHIYIEKLLTDIFFGGLFIRAGTLLPFCFQLSLSAIFNALSLSFRLK